MVANLVKLTKPGETLTLTVERCAKATRGTYPGVEFEGVTPEGERVVVEVPESSAERQLSRLGLDHAGAVGRTLVISRAPNAAAPLKPFWDIAAVGAAPKSNGTPKPSQAAPHDIPPQDSSRFPFDASAGDEEPEPPPQQESGAILYEKITRYVFKTIAPIYKSNNCEPSAETIAAITATLYIAATKRSNA